MVGSPIKGQTESRVFKILKVMTEHKHPEHKSKEFKPQTGVIKPSSGKGQPDSEKAPHVVPTAKTAPTPSAIQQPNKPHFLVDTQKSVHEITTDSLPNKLAQINTVLSNNGMDSQQVEKAMKEIRSILGL